MGDRSCSFWYWWWSFSAWEKPTAGSGARRWVGLSYWFMACLFRPGAGYHHFWQPGSPSESRARGRGRPGDQPGSAYPPPVTSRYTPRVKAAIRVAEKRSRTRSTPAALRAA